MNKTFAINNTHYKDEDEVAIGGKQYLIISHSVDPNGNTTVNLTGNDGDTKLCFNSMGLSLDEATQEACGIRMARKRNFKEWDIVITEGGNGHNVNGNYSILSMDEELSKMEVEYLDGQMKGTKQKLDIFGQAEHMHREAVRQMQQFGTHLVNMLGQNESFTLGYLASNGILDCTVSHSHLQTFLDAYEKMTGESAKPHLGKGNLNQGYIWVRNIDTGGPTFRIIFKEPSVEVLNMMQFNGEEHDKPIPIPGQHTYGLGDAMTFNGRNFFFNLIRMGFRFGNKQNIDVIRSNISDVKMFNEGVVCGQATNPAV